MKNRRISLDATLRILLLVLLGSLAVLFVAELLLSLGWRMSLDTPVLHYISFLMDEYDFVPYRDIFDCNIPGTYFFHSALTALFGYGDFAFRCVDVLFVLLLSWVTWSLMKKFGPLPAVAGVVIFGLHYLRQGPNMSLERDVLCILPVASALLLVTSSIGKNRPYLTAALLGALTALTVTIKPFFMIGVLPIAFYFYRLHRGEGEASGRSTYPFLLYSLLLAAAGFLVIFGIPFLWIVSKGGFPYFLEIAKSYIPLYVNLSGTLKLMEGSERWIYFINFFIDMGQRNLFSIFLLAPTFLGCYLLFSDPSSSPSRRRFALLLVSLCLAYAVYPVSQGKFWTTHYMPMQYFLILASSLVFLTPASRKPPVHRRLIPLFAFVVFVMLGIRPTHDFVPRLRGEPIPSPNDGRVDEIARYLEDHLEPGDTVQPLDFIRGALHAMLITKSEMATPFMYDLQFYHHVSNPYIQGLRREFISQLETRKPRFILRVTDKPWPHGRDTTRSFPELERILEEEYRVVLAGDGYDILERKTGMGES